jgi:hypothetical protein
MDGKTLFSGVAQSGVAAIDAGTSCRKAAATFQVSVSTVIVKSAVLSFGRSLPVCPYQQHSQGPSACLKRASNGHES